MLMSLFWLQVRPQVSALGGLESKEIHNSVVYLKLQNHYSSFYCHFHVHERNYVPQLCLPNYFLKFIKRATILILHVADVKQLSQKPLRRTTENNFWQLD